MRRLAVVVVAVVLTAGLAGCDAWPMFRFDAAHTGFNPSENRIGVENVSTLKQAWTWTANTGGQGRSSPAVSGGAVYLAAGNSDTTRLYLFRASTGQLLCQSDVALGFGTLSSPAVGGGDVYVVLGNTSVSAYDASCTRNCSGTPTICQPLWTAGSYSGPAPTYGNNGLVYDEAYVGGASRNLVAFDARTGATRWKSTVGLFFDSSPAVSDGVVYAGSNDGNLYAFSANGTTNCSGAPRTCAPLWAADLGGGTDASPAVANGVVYVSSSSGKLYAFDAAGSTSCSGTPKTCTPLWTATLSGPTVASDSSPAIADGVVYAEATDGPLYAFDAAGETNCSGSPKACTPLWSAATSQTSTDDSQTSPTVANGVVYIGSPDNFVYGFDAAGNTNCSGTPKACTPLWRGAAAGGVRSSPAIFNGFVYASAANDNLHAYTLP